jgi:hypothetical protein
MDGDTPAAQGTRAPGGYVDQVARKEEFEAAHPGARIWREGRNWLAEMPGGARTAPEWHLERALDRAERLAGAEE